MGFFNFLFGKSPRKRQNDYFEGYVFFKPTGKEVEWLIEGRNEPSVEQQAFVERVQTNYELVKSESIRVITNDFRNWKEDFVIENFAIEFTPVAISTVEIADGQQVKWEIAYESIHDLNHIFTVNFEDWQASSVLIDG